MEKIRDFLAHPVIQLALAVGASILILSYFSKRVLPEPLTNLELALPQLLAVLLEGLARMQGYSWYRRNLGVLVVVTATFLVIVFNA